ncbi:hypothetical protein LQ954_12535 [Sphingomonas sp. IC-11]|uniref:hypothetical protein n=1 Tax=Sphingomonas sp. IC-11 TaxID=2898528 RepID=UPI001E293BEE|nr:hypothetical protein [Sphingomonas sp. IC-11]MCD2316975.1 hypothetical protein [Sphingomonas sp. IC-11]
MSQYAPRAYQFTYDKAGVRDDLERCKQEDRYAYGRIFVLLEQLLGDPADCERFITEGWQDNQIEDVTAIRSLLDERIDGVRTKLWDVRAWRLLFICDLPGRRAGLVAIMHRSQNYEDDHELWDRIRNAVQRFGFGRY